MTCCGEYMEVEVSTSLDQKTKTTTYTCKKCGRKEVKEEKIKIPKT